MFCSWLPVVQAVAAAVQSLMAAGVLENAAQRKFDYDANALYYCGSKDIARTCKIGWINLDASSKVQQVDLLLPNESGLIASTGFISFIQGRLDVTFINQHLCQLKAAATLCLFNRRSADSLSFQQTGC
jgi:hypothetical protein